MGQFIWSRLRILIMVVVLTSVGLSFTPASVDAGTSCRTELLPTCSYMQIYYSDAQLTNEVGRHFWPCDGPTRLVGQTTNFTAFFVIGSCSEAE